jgi:YD repeat-containing protein
MKEIREYDKNGNLTYCRYPDGYERWIEYDDRGNRIHYRDSDGDEWWREYDENNKLISTRTKGEFDMEEIREETKDA